MLRVPRSCTKLARSSARHLHCAQHARTIHSRTDNNRPTGSDRPTMSMSGQSMQSDNGGDGQVRAPPIIVHTESSPTDTGAPLKTIWDLQDENCILSKKL